MANQGSATSLPISVMPGKNFAPVIPRGDRHRIARRVISTMIDEALDRARVRPDQRFLIYQARDRMLSKIDEYLVDRDAAACRLVEAELWEEAQRCFLGRLIDHAPLDARRAEPEYRQLVRAIALSVRDMRDVLTPSQEQAIVEYMCGRTWGIDR